MNEARLLAGAATGHEHLRDVFDYETGAGDPADRGPDGGSTAIDSHRGVPSWLASNLNFCSRCGGPLRFGDIEGEDRKRLGCDACGFVAYVNPRLVATTIPVLADGRVVLLRRGIEPGYGAWAPP